MSAATTVTATTPAMRLGMPRPLGASMASDKQGGGVNFAVFSENATRIDLCLYDASGRTEQGRITLPGFTDGVWHGLLPNAGAGQVYGFRAYGPDDPIHGHRFTPAKLMLDPYALAIQGTFVATDSHLGDANAAQDNARDTVKSVVVDPASEAFDWQGDRSPAVPMADSVLYEVHVKGFSQLHPGVPEDLRGTYEGMAAPASIEHLKKLGITAVSLLPVHYAIDEMPLSRRGVSNYWAYNTLGYFAPNPRYARSAPRDEFRRMVRGLHAAGIEVILDVVYNHTCEGDQRGPTVCWRGLDNASYYRLRREDKRFYENHSGTGNTLNLEHPRVLQMVMDSLRFWVTEMHVDGFRFDLATSLARGDQGYSQRANFLQCVAQDPVLSRVKMIAEPWDIGPGGYQVGGFPAGWSEWNDKYRDAVRAFWVRKTADRGEIAKRIAGSSDIYNHGTRTPQATINFVAAHDGFTLLDLLSYDRKHNDANGEDNRDGTDNNLSWNCGVEGDTKLLAINALRSRLQRGITATLMLSQGVPMMLGGDEIGRTQQGNNNSYNQDNAINWYDWSNVDHELYEFFVQAIALRRRYPQLCRVDWLTGQVNDEGRRDVVWVNRLGDEMTEPQWDEANRFVFGMMLAGVRAGQPTVLILLNAEARDWAMKIPAGNWRVVLDTGARNSFDVGEPMLDAFDRFVLKSRSLTLLELTDGP